MPGAHPYSRQTSPLHPLARMLPLFHYQRQVYRLGEKDPPCGDLDGYGPVWEAVSFVLSAQGTLQARVNLQRDFTLIAVASSASVNTIGGFRAQLFDTRKQRLFMERMTQKPNISDSSVGAFFLRDPYTFDQPDSQVLVMMQNMETAANTVQIVLYGQCLRFNDPTKKVMQFPGGPIASDPSSFQGESS